MAMRKRYKYDIRCNYCGRFISRGWVYTPWGTYEDFEPPDDKFICDKCFTPDTKKLLDRMWHPPVRWISYSNIDLLGG